MVNYTEAHRRISRWLDDQSARTNLGLALIDQRTLETEFGWVFFYTAKLVEEAAVSVGGNAPVIIDRTIGSVHITGTALPAEHYIEEFRRTRKMVGLSTATFVGEPPDDNAVLAKLPRDYAAFLQVVNGCIVYGGGLHIRGASPKPDWHSLRQAWFGESCLSQTYAEVRADDVPFAQDYLGDQFLLRSGSVLRLRAETGEVEDLAVDWREFLAAAAANPSDVLSLQLLRRFQGEGKSLAPGHLLSVYPPLCTKESAQVVSLKAIPARERIRYLADLAAQIRDMPNGSKVRMIVQ